MSDDDLDMPRPPQSADDWSKYAYYVLEELKASRARDAMLDKKIEDMLSAQSTSERTLLRIYRRSTSGTRLRPVGASEKAVGVSDASAERSRVVGGPEKTVGASVRVCLKHFFLGLLFGAIMMAVVDWLSSL
jgi:hypothetical protein